MNKHFKKKIYLIVKLKYLKDTKKYMEKYNKLLSNITELVEKGLLNSKHLKKDVKDSIKQNTDKILSKLNLVSREEFEVQKKVIEKLRKDLLKIKIKKTTKAKKP
jgi:BMFP domain-containing protein YqiC